MEQIEVRALNEKGLEILYDFILELKLKPNMDDSQVPYHLLTDPDYLTHDKYNSEIEPNHAFDSRYDFSEYLNKALPKNIETDQFKNYGLWAWLGLAYFSQIRNPSRRKSEFVYIIPSEYKNIAPRHWYRHSVRGPLMLYRGNYIKDFVKLMLSAKTNAMGAFYENCVGNRKIRRNSLTQKTIVAMYQGDDGKPKKGFDAHGQNKGKGGLRRFISIILPRIQETFDNEILETTDFIKIWGREALSSKFCPTSLKEH